MEHSDMESDSDSASYTSYESRSSLDLDYDVARSINSKKTPLMIAARDGMAETVIQLLKDGADINAKDGYGLTALTYAAREGNWSSIVEMLLECKNINLDPALAYAAGRGHLDVMKLLISHGADLNVPNDRGRTALQLVVLNASRSGRRSKAEHLDVIKLLLARNANPDIQAKDGATALMLAVELDQQEVTKLLLDYNARTDLKDNRGDTALHLMFKD